MGHVDGLAIDGDSEGGGAHLRGDGHGLNTGCGMSGDGEQESGDEERTENLQEANPRRESGNRLL